MTDTAVLNRLIEQSSESKEGIAARLGISLSSLNNKISNRTEFKASEIDMLQSILRMNKTLVFDVFFANKVSSYDTGVSANV